MRGQSVPTDNRGASSALPHANKGKALYRLGWFHEWHLQEAVTSFRRALELDDKSLQARNGLGVCLLELGQPAAAAVEFLRAAEQAPNDPYLRYNYAFACTRQGRMDRAKTELARVLDDDPTYEPARRTLDLLTAEPARPDLWQEWTQGSAWRRALGTALLGTLGLLVMLPIVYLLRPSIEGPELPWQYYVAALAVVAGALVLPAVRQLRAFGVELVQPPLRAFGVELVAQPLSLDEPQLEPVFRP